MPKMILCALSRNEHAALIKIQSSGRCLQMYLGKCDWYGRKLSAEDWKHVFTASLKQIDTVPGIDGGIVVLGQSTSKMTVSQMRDLIELINAFGAEHDVSWSDFYERQ